MNSQEEYEYFFSYLGTRQYGTQDFGMGRRISDKPFQNYEDIEKFVREFEVDCGYTKVTLLWYNLIRPTKVVT